MSITPPVAVPLLIIVAVVAFALMRPPEMKSDRVQLTITVSGDVYRSLSARVTGRLDPEGRPLTVERWLADEAERDTAP